MRTSPSRYRAVFNGCGFGFQAQPIFHDLGHAHGVPLLSAPFAFPRVIGVSEKPLDVHRTAEKTLEDVDTHPVMIPVAAAAVCSIRHTVLT